MSVSNRTITSLALLKVYWDYLRRDILETFVPMVGTLLRQGGYTAIRDDDVHRLCADFEREFGFQVPYHPMISILERARKRGLVSRWHRSFVPTMSKLESVDIRPEVANQEKALEVILSGASAFAKNELSTELSRDEVLEALVGFLRRHDLDILFAAGNGSVLPNVTPSKKARYVVARYAQHLHEEGASAFRFLVDIAVGHVLASVLLYKEIGRYGSKLDGVHIYLDTRYALRLLGAEGPDRQLSYYTLSSALRSAGADLRMFSHTYDEMMGILHNCLRWTDNKQFDPSKASMALLFFVQQGKHKSDVQAFIDSADGRLEDSGVKCVETPAPSELSDYQVDEDALREKILGVYEMTDPAELSRSEYTIDRDIKSIAAVHKLRKGRSPIALRRAEHVFVTTNGGLAHASRLFELSQGAPGREIPACLTDVFIGTVLWLQSPTTAQVLNEARIIAQCSAALQLGDSAIRRVVEVATELKRQGRVTEDQFYLLRASPVVHEMLADKALGDPRAFSARTVEETLLEVEEEARRPILAKYAREREAHLQARHQVAELQLAYAEREAGIDHIADVAGKISAQAAKWACFVLSATAIVFSFSDLPQWLPVRVFALTTSVVFGAGGFVIDFGGVGPRIHDSVQRRVALALRRLPGSAPEMTERLPEGSVPRKLSRSP